MNDEKKRYIDNLIKEYYDKFDNDSFVKVDEDYSYIMIGLPKNSVNYSIGLVYSILKDIEDNVSKTCDVHMTIDIKKNINMYCIDFNL